MLLRYDFWAMHIFLKSVTMTIFQGRFNIFVKSFCASTINRNNVNFLDVPERLYFRSEVYIFDFFNRLPAILLSFWYSIFKLFFLRINLIQKGRA